MPTETFTIDFEANTGPLEARLVALANQANAFSGAIAQAFKDAIVGGKSFETVLSSLILRLSNIALNKALAPLGNLIGNLFGSFGLPATNAATTAPPLSFAGLSAQLGAAANVVPPQAATAGRAVPAAAPAVVNFAITTPDADSFRKSEAQVTAMLARAVGRGRRGL